MTALADLGDPAPCPQQTPAPSSAVYPLGSGGEVAASRILLHHLCLRERLRLGNGSKPPSLSMDVGRLRHALVPGHVCHAGPVQQTAPVWGGNTDAVLPPKSSCPHIVVIENPSACVSTFAKPPLWSEVLDHQWMANLLAAIGDRHDCSSLAMSSGGL